MPYGGIRLLRIFALNGVFARTAEHRLTKVRTFTCSSHTCSRYEEPEFVESSYRNELHVVGTAVSDPVPRYKIINDPDENKGDPIGYSFNMDIPSYGKDLPTRCSVVAYTFPNGDIANYISSTVRKGVHLEIDGFLRKTVSKMRLLDEQKPMVFYSIGPKNIKILDEITRHDDENDSEFTD